MIEIITAFGELGASMFGSAVVIGLVILCVFAYFLLKSGKAVADLGLIIMTATIILLSWYGFLPNWVGLVTVMILAGIFFMALKTIFGR